MAHGGGSWLTQNKVMPGTYINFTSLTKSNAALSDRGIAAAPFALNWGPEGTVFSVTSSDFQKNSKTIFGYDFDAPETLCLREIFCHATKVYCYRLGKGGTQATCTYGTAKHPGVRGNDITCVIAKNVDNNALFEVSTLIDGKNYETQIVKAATELIDNAFITFKKDATLAVTVGTKLTGGLNATTITGESHQDFLDKIESYSFNTLCCPISEAETVKLYVNYTKRVRDELGAKFQLVAWQPAGADYEGVIGVWNTSKHPQNADTHSLVYWVTGAQAGAAVNASITNATYDGELVVDINYTQSELEACIKEGKLMLHSVNGTVRVLEDINTLVTLTSEKGDIFQSNQTVRVCDQIANDVAVLFNTRYVGAVPNDASGRATLWNDVVKIIRQLESVRAIENFDTDKVTVELGDNKKAVALTLKGINIVNAMSQLYMSVIIQ